MNNPVRDVLKVVGWVWLVFGGIALFVVTVNATTVTGSQFACAVTMMSGIGLFIYTKLDEIVELLRKK